MTRRFPALAAIALGCLGVLGCAPKAAGPSEPSNGGAEAAAQPQAQKYWKLTEARYGASKAAPEAPMLGDKVEDFELPDADGGTFKLSTALAVGKPVVLVFYRGFW